MKQTIDFKTQLLIAAPFFDRLLDKRLLYFASKRLIDGFVAAIALVFLLPFLLVIAMLIRLDSAGPVFFRQQRVGTKRVKINGVWTWQTRPFTCYKFRTMHQHADPALHQAYIKAQIHPEEHAPAEIQNSDPRIKKLSRDPRVTRVGWYLRRSSLDELPQFWNILKGNMSLVGPRPAIPYEVEMYKPWYARRLNAKPGLTGLWQISGRSTLGFEEMVDLDIQYTQRQSFWLDLTIVIKTPLVILSRKGAA